MQGLSCQAASGRGASLHRSLVNLEMSNSGLLKRLKQHNMYVIAPVVFINKIGNVNANLGLTVFDMYLRIITIFLNFH